MRRYQLRLLAAGGSVHARVEVDFGSDKLAIEAVARAVSGPAMELWEGSRLVARFEATAEFEGREARSAPRDAGPPIAARIVTLLTR